MWKPATIKQFKYPAEVAWTALMDSKRCPSRPLFSQGKKETSDSNLNCKNSVDVLSFISKFPKPLQYTSSGHDFVLTDHIKSFRSRLVKFNERIMSQRCSLVRCILILNTNPKHTYTLGAIYTLSRLGSN